MVRRGSLVLLVLLLAMMLAPLAGPAYAGRPAPPPTGTDFDYQLGGNRSVPDHVGIVVRDRQARAADGLYNICYINGFQTQPDEKRFWRRHWRLVLKKHGEPVVDEAWGEWLLDIRTAPKRKQLTSIMGRWIDRCAADGYAAVDFDNLDSFARSHRLISRADSTSFARSLVRRTHAAGLAVGQKNRAQWDGSTVGFDFAIAEECARWHECGDYVRHYGRHVLAVEYRATDFRIACRNWAEKISVVRRDVALSTRGVRTWC